MSETIIIRGSWGDIRADRATGCILSYNDHGRHGWAAGEVGYSDIAFLIPETLAPGRDECLDAHGETDILCVGFVDTSGRVTEPMQRDAEGLYFDPLLLPAPGAWTAERETA